MKQSLSDLSPSDLAAVSGGLNCEDGIGFKYDFFGYELKVCMHLW